MATVSWLEIRKWNGSQSDAFEELCCQLAHSEPIVKNSRFFTKGRPDSGIECYWVLPSGEEWGWQAKFFTDGLNKQRWAQCDDSVKKALDGHPKITKLFFCFPYRFPDSRKSNEVTAAKHWESHCAKWTGWSKKRGLSLEFILWDEHELVLRLSRPEHRGRWWFWFDTPTMDPGWFKRNLDAAVLLAGERYTPDLHFDLPLVQYFDALGRTPAFFVTLGELGRKLDKAIADVTPSLCLNDATKEPRKEVWNSLHEALATVNTLTLDSKLPINFSKLERALISARDQVQTALHEAWDKQKLSGGHLHDHRSFSDYRLREMYSCIEEVAKFCKTPNANLANLPAMLLIGEAGLGKTHLICLVAENRIASELPTIVLLGQQFNESEPWSQIIAATTLVWCLTTSDRFVRDRATKALVSLLEQRTTILRWLLDHFADVAEPYLQERLHAVAYGCAMLTRLNASARNINGSPMMNFTPESVIISDLRRTAHL
jgi:hypothetical protein